MADSTANTARALAHARKHARRLVIQALYQWQLTGDDIRDIYRQFRDDPVNARADMEYFRELLLGVPRQRAKVDAMLSPHMERTIDEVDPVERAILRLAAYELEFRPDVPYRVVLNEAVELTKKFGASQAYRFVNGVLDRVARARHQTEQMRED